MTTKRRRHQPPPEKINLEYAELLGDQLVAELLGVRYMPRVHDPVFEETWASAYEAARDLSAGDITGAGFLSGTLHRRVLDLGPDDIIGSEYLSRLCEAGGGHDS